MNTENLYFFANNTESPFLTLFSFVLGGMCPHRSNCAINTEKRKKNLIKGTNKITLRKIQKLRIQNFFSKRFKSIYGLPYFELKKTPYFVLVYPSLGLNSENPYFFAKNSESPFLTLFSLGIYTMCPHCSNCPKTTENQIFFPKKGTNKKHCAKCK